jgi:hypothetical protein
VKRKREMAFDDIQVEGVLEGEMLHGYDPVMDSFPRSMQGYICIKREFGRTDGGDSSGLMVSAANTWLASLRIHQLWGGNHVGGDVKQTKVHAMDYPAVSLRQS